MIRKYNNLFRIMYYISSQVISYIMCILRNIDEPNYEKLIH